MATKLPPQNIEAEESVLGSLLINKEAMHRIADTLRPEDFYKPAHSEIYKSILKLHEKNEPIDVLTLTSELNGRGKLKEIGGSSYLARLIESVPSSQHIEHYGKIVKEKKILRDLINTSTQISEDAFGATEDIDQVLDNIEQKIFAISQRSVAQRFTSIKDELKAAYERIEKLHSGEGKLRGVPSGFDGIDNILSGFQKSDLILIGARPSLGKTSLALSMLRHAAVKENIPVGFFSIEMSREQVIDRLISLEAGVPLWKLRTGRLKDEQDFHSIQNALDTLSKAPIYIDDTPSPNILQMRSMARRLQAEHGLGIIAVDYLQLIQPRTGSDNIVAQVTEISRGLKAIARELNTPVLALSQLSRSSDQREVKIPRLSDLRDSGSLEQDADIVMFIYRKDKDRANIDPQEENTAEIIIAKHRNGPLGTVKLKFDDQTASFRNIDTQHESLEL
ncbi:MAG: replicative DNA helicase [Candidatus Harrisonbacteria bacterium]|nr:replicative DNA helicase [Candidatus Harrisonbacteria bacterium]